MLTANDLVAIISVIALCVTCFCAGYAVGKDSTQKHR